MSPSKPRVAFVLSDLNSGGAERAALNAAHALKHSEGVIIAERTGGDLSRDPLARDVVYASQSGRRANRAIRTARLVRALHRARAEVVFAMLSPVVSAAAAKVLRLPVIHWLQAPWSETTDAARRDLRGRVANGFLRASTSGRTIVAGATPGLCGECVGLGIASSKIGLLPNGLQLARDIGVSGLAEDRHASDLARIVTVGRLEEPKRHDLLLHAFARIVRDTPARLTIVGSGQREAELRTLARDLEVSQHTEFVGFVDDPSHHVRAADAFVLATDYEGFGNVIVEALACGTRVVVSDVPYGPRFILADGRYGSLVAPRSVDALEQGLREALARGLTPAGRAAGRARAEQFSLDVVVDRLEQLVAHLLTEKGAPVPTAYTRWP